MKKRTSITPDNIEEFVKTVIERYEQDLSDRSDWSEARLQRYAKLRGWLEAKNYPWPDASNQHIPLLMSNSQRTQDTLHNAVMGTRPVMSAIAINSADADKGKSIDELQDYQLFVEQHGEEKVGQLIASFVDDGNFVAFIPWVKEKREVIEIKPVPNAPEGMAMGMLHQEVMRQQFPDGFAEPIGQDEARYKIRVLDEYGKPETVEAEFYEDEDGKAFVQYSREKCVFEGPCVIPKALEDIVVPSRAENLQPPGPSNPNGADHVIMVDYPSWDEINRLQRSGYYDLLKGEAVEKLEERVESGAGETGLTANDPEQHKIQRDALAGQTYGNAKTTSKVFTRLTYFGRFDLDDDGLEEEIVARVLLESKQLCRLRHLQEEYPTPTPRRPFAMAKYLEVPGQFYGISLLEMLEHMHDLIKVLLDQMIDKHSIANLPWGLYRSGSNVRPEVIQIQPGVLAPVSDPSRDVVFPQMPQQDQSVALNLIALVQQMADKQSMQGSLQFGGVPQGKASALRTSTNMMSVLQQGDARPERILRRFFRGLAEIYQQMHELNQAFLPPNKQYRVTGVVAQGADPYREVKSPSEISGPFQFDFKANSLNTNKAMKGQILQGLLPILVNGMTMQMGLVTVEEIYNLINDIITSSGQDDNRYVKAPPQSNQPKITAEDAMGQMAAGQLPQGLPAEGAQMHLDTLQRFQQDPRFTELLQQDQAFPVIFHTYLQQVQARVQQEMMQAQMAQQFAQSMGGQGGGTGGPQGGIDPMADQMNLGQGPNQPGDESLPGAKGMVQ